VKVPLSWLKEFVEINLPVPELAHRLTMAGLEVEEAHKVGSDWRNITIARVASLEKHPKSDTLHIAQLDEGGAPITIVTAAQNLFVGAVVPHIGPGGKLAKGEIGVRSLVGIESQGMVCSGEELGISPDDHGIYILEDTAPIGVPLADYLDETVLDLYITANRSDCMSIIGIAREVHALTAGKLTLPTVPTPKGSTPSDQLIGVTIEDATGCPRFVANVISGVKVGPSPLWLQRRLFYAGIRPISNVVDVTNYVMLEYGQPLHSFDRAKLHGNITVRRAKQGEKLTTLDNVERTLTDDMLLVCDDSGPRSLAGVMGGLDSEISDDTVDVVMEGANWDRASIRRTSSALNLSSEAGRRFGRGVDPELASVGVSRAVELTLQLAGGSSSDGLVDNYPGKKQLSPITFNPNRIGALLGTSYTREQITGSLTGLGFGIQEQGDQLVVTVPTHRRYDVERVADLAEEVGRVVGYESIPTTKPAQRLPDPRGDGDSGYADELKARRALAAAGLREVINYSLVEPALAAKMDPTAEWPTQTPPADQLRTANPMSVDQSVLRPSLLGSLLETLRNGLKQRERVLVFELARTWQGSFDATQRQLPDERRKVALALTGPRATQGWEPAAEPLDFYDLKGFVDQLGATFRLNLSYDEGKHASFHPGRTARVLVDGYQIGIIGQLHPKIAERFDLEGRQVLAGELDFEKILAHQRKLEKVRTPSRYPAAQRDLAVVLDEEIPHGQVHDVIRDAAGELLQALGLFDVYRGDPIPAGKKSLAFSLTYQADDRTLEDAEVAKLHASVEQSVVESFAGEIRGR
jgi:phenylalanyl-tRNA synthetase beta chain